MINIVVSLALFGLVKALVLGVCTREQMHRNTLRLAFFLIASAVWPFMRTAKLCLRLLIESHDGLHGEGPLRAADAGVAGKSSNR